MAVKVLITAVNRHIYNTEVVYIHTLYIHTSNFSCVELLMRSTHVKFNV